MAIVKTKLDGVVPYLGGGLSARLGLIHRQQRRRGHVPEGDGDFFLPALIVASGARTVVAQQGKIEVALVAIGPGDVHTRARLYVNLHRDRFSAFVDG